MNAGSTWVGEYLTLLFVHVQVLAQHPNYPQIKEDILDVGMRKIRAGSEREERRAHGLLQAAALEN